MGIINPYENINWQTYQKIISTSHAHAKTQSQFDCLYAGGVRHIAVSNYYRSEPFYPIVNGFISEIETVDKIAIPTDCIPCPNA